CVRRVTLSLLALTTAAHAQSVAFTYDQWERLPIGMRELYVAGAVDTAPPKFYNDCLMKKQITADALAEEMKTIVQTRLELHPKPATGRIIGITAKVVWITGA